MALAVTIEDMFLAYRKAKADVFFEHTSHVSFAFADLERDLASNLERLRDRILSTDRRWLNALGTYRFVPKAVERASVEVRGDEPFFMDSERVGRWGLSEGVNPKGVTAAFRMFSACSPEFHILSALWINKVGHKYDATNGQNSLGSRLKRTGKGVGQGSYNLSAVGSFRPYASDFKRWRGYAFASIKRRLADGEAVIAVTLDLKGFYHNVNPSFLLRDAYIAEHGIELSESERDLTGLLIEAIAAWAKATPLHSEEQSVGLPIGLTASRVIANAVMASWDHAIVGNLRPVYYGRYVDDMLLVLSAGDRRSWGDVWRFIQSRIGSIITIAESSDGNAGINIHLPYAADSKLLLDGAKQRMFLLREERGRDLLAVIEQQIREQSSEWRLLPEIPTDETEWFKDVMVADAESGDPVDNLRKAEGISIRRLKFAMLLRNLEAIDRQLKPKVWSTQREIFYRFAQRHLITPEAVFDFTPFLKRIIELAIACGDNKWAKELISHVGKTIGFLEQNTLTRFNGLEYRSFRKYLGDAFYDALLKAGLSAPNESKLATIRNAISRVAKWTPHDARRQDVLPRSRAIAIRDLGRVPARAGTVGILRGVERKPSADAIHLPTVAARRALRVGVLRYFHGLLETKVDAKIVSDALLFPTRPYTFGEITFLAPELLLRERFLASVTKAVRGSVPRARVSAFPKEDLLDIRINTLNAPTPSDPVVALPCLLTDDRSWHAAAKGRPDHGIHRLLQINSLLNQVLRAQTRPNYVVLPELSVPRAWMYGVAYKLAKSGISSVVGLEYEHWGRQNVEFPRFSGQFT